jgi:hypothetical protein
MLEKSLQVMNAELDTELEGEGWFQLFGRGITEPMFARWLERPVAIEEPANDVYDTEDKVSPEELTGYIDKVAVDDKGITEDRGVIQDEDIGVSKEVFWEHYCSIQGGWIGTDKEFPCDFCGETEKVQENPWTHFCNIRGHLVYTDKGGVCDWCGASE